MFLTGIPLSNPPCSQQFFPFDMVRLAGNSLLLPILDWSLRATSRAQHSSQGVAYIQFLFIVGI